MEDLSWTHAAQCSVTNGTNGTNVTNVAIAWFERWLLNKEEKNE